MNQMNDAANAARLIDFKDLLYRTARKWRTIILAALIVALLAALFQVFLGLRVLLDEERFEDAKGKYEIAVADYEATAERLRASIANLRDQSANQQEYNNKSELMKIDPMNKWTGTVQIYVDSKYQIDPSLTYQNVDLTSRLIAAYSSYLRSGELYNEMLESLDTVDEIRFLTEIYDVDAEPGAASISIRAVGKSEADVRKITDYIKMKIGERYDVILNAIGDHTFEIMTESVYSSIDLDLDAKQKSNLLAIANYSNEIGEQSEQLKLWEKSDPPKMEYGAVYTVRQAVKSFIIGGVISAVVMFCWFALDYAIRSTAKTPEDWASFSLPVLGCIDREEKKRKLSSVDALIDRIFARRQKMTTEQSCALTARNLGAVLQEQGIDDAKLIGAVDKAYAEHVVQRMAASAPEIRFSFAGDPLTDPETAKNLERTEKVVLIADNRTTQIKAIQQTLTLIRAWGKTVLGVIVVD